MSYQVGDKVKVVNDFHIWLTGYGLDRETILTIVEKDDEHNSFVNADYETIEIEAVNEYPNDFEKVEDMFFAGCNPPELTFGLMGEQINEEFFPLQRPTKQVTGMWELNKSDNIEDLREQIFSVYRNVINQAHENKEPQILGPVNTTPQGEPVPIASNCELGVYRPNLEDRKVGKIGMHMVDDGFPNALRAVAEVMTWAAVAKGYKLHDWKNLPEADVALPSAGYRHRNDNSVQKAQGLKALDRTDHESNLLHKAHEAFNTLAELELIITGVIK